MGIGSTWLQRDVAVFVRHFEHLASAPANAAVLLELHVSGDGKMIGRYSTSYFAYFADK